MKTFLGIVVVCFLFLRVVLIWVSSGLVLLFGF
jgi:hypothetical protein